MYLGIAEARASAAFLSPCTGCVTERTAPSAFASFRSKYKAPLFTKHGSAHFAGRKNVSYARQAGKGRLLVSASSSAPRERREEPSRESSKSVGNTSSFALPEVGEVVAGKYRIKELIGQGSNGTTYAAQKLDSPTEELVALKVLSLRGSKDWKAIELFEREARVLSQLDHPGIPEYVDYFEVDTATDRSFYISQKLAPGISLQDKVEGGWLPSEEEAVRITLELLQVLEYLEAQRPQVVHRDIKPANIVLDGDGGKVSLVDFGAVAAVNPNRIGSTIVGTYGYMSPEQFRGDVTPVSDLYAVGACLLFLLTGSSPSEFPQKRLKVDVSKVRASALVKSVLERLLEPLPEDRMQSAKQTAAALVGGGALGSKSASSTGGVKRKPVGTKVEFLRMGDERLEVKIPSRGITQDTAMQTAFAVTWNGFVGSWTFGALAGGGLLFAAFSIPFWVAGYGLAKDTVNMFREDALDIGPNCFTITSGSETIEGNTADLDRVEVLTSMVVNGQPQTVLQLSHGVNRYQFGAGLAFVEQQWLAEEIRAFLKDTPTLPYSSF